MAKSYFRILLPAILLAAPAFAQPEVMAWGNISGIRVDGQLMELGSSLCVARPDWSGVTRTGRSGRPAATPAPARSRP